MRHQCNKKIGINLSIQSLIFSAIENKKMVSTVSKIKLLKPILEKIISKYIKLETEMAKIRYLQSFGSAMPKIKNSFDAVSQNHKERAGGYTKITLLHPRKGDMSAMAMLEIL